MPEIRGVGKLFDRLSPIPTVVSIGLMLLLFLDHSLPAGRQKSESAEDSIEDS